MHYRRRRQQGGSDIAQPRPGWVTARSAVGACMSALVALGLAAPTSAATKRSRWGISSRRWIGRKAVLAAVTGALAASTLAACGPADRAAAGGGSIYPMGDVILPSQMSNINPFQLTGNWQALFQYLYDPLYYFDPVNGSLVPDLAAQGKWGASGTTYTVTLNNKATWQNGTPVTAADVVYTFGVLKSYPAADPDAIWSHLASVTGSGHTVVFHLTSPYRTLPNLLSQVYIVPKAIWQQYANPLNVANMHPVGSGPWELQSYQSGVAINLKPNPHYFLGAPKLAGLSIAMYENSTSLTLDLEKGVIDTTAGLAMTSLSTLLSDKSNKFQLYPGLDTYQVLENNQVAGLDNVDVRHAIQLAINQKFLIQQAELGGVVRQNPGWLPPAFGNYVNKATYDGPSATYSPAQAKALLKKAGYHMGPNGIMQKNGRPLTFTYYEQSAAPAQDKEGQLIEGWLNDIGIGTTTRLVTGPELTSLASTGNYQLMQTGVFIPPDPVASLISFLGSASTAPSGEAAPGLNYSRFKSPELDRLLSEAASTLSTATRTRLLDQAQQVIAAASPVAVMYDSGGHSVYRTDQFTGYDTKFPIPSPWSLDTVVPVK